MMEPIPYYGCVDDDDCSCTFDPYEDGPYEESCHFKRTCPDCGEVWWALHCAHDGVQNPCPGCGSTFGRPTPIESLYGPDRIPPGLFAGLGLGTPICNHCAAGRHGVCLGYNGGRHCGCEKGPHPLRR